MKARNISPWCCQSLFISNNHFPPPGSPYINDSAVPKSTECPPLDLLEKTPVGMACCTELVRVADKVSRAAAPNWSWLRWAWLRLAVKELSGVKADGDTGC